MTLFFTKPDLDFSSGYVEPKPVDPNDTASIMDVGRAAYDSAKKTNEIMSGHLNLRSVYDDHNAKVKALTGADLANPENGDIGVYDFDTRRKIEMDWQQYQSDGGTLSRNWFLRQWRENDYKRQLGELAEKHPDKRNEILPKTSFQSQAFDVARRAEETELATWEKSKKGAAGWAAWLGGNLAAAATDPVNMITAPIGFGAGTGIKGLLAAALKAGAVNASVEAGVQPFVQDYRNQVGLTSGIGPAALAIGSAAGFGAGLDLGVRGTFRGVAHGFGYEPVVKDGIVVSWRKKPIDAQPSPEIKAKPQLHEIPHETMIKAADGDMAALRKVYESDANTDPVVRQMLDAMDAEERLAAKPLETIDDATHAATLTQAARAIADPDSEPMPVRVDATPPVEGVSAKIEAELSSMKAKAAAEPDNAELATRIADAEAQIRAIDGFGSDPVRDAALLRDGAPITTDMNLTHPGVQQARALAALSDEAFAMVRDGSATPEIGAMVANFVGDRRHHSAILSDVVKMRPVSDREARAVIAELVRSPEYTPSTPVDMRRLDDPYGAAAKAQVAQLEREMQEELAAAGRATPEEIIATPEGQAAAIARANDVRAAIAELTGIAPPEIQVRVFSRIDDLPSHLSAKVRMANARVFSGAMKAFQAARSLDERLAAKLSLDAAARGEGIEGIADDAAIWIASYAMDPKGRMSHEVVHWLRTTGRLSPDEMATLAKASREAGVWSKAREDQYRDEYSRRDGDVEALLEEEAAAHFVEAVVRGDVVRPLNAPQAMSIVERIRQFFAKIKDALTGRGFRDATVETRDPALDVVDSLLAGDIAKREQRSEWMRQTSGERPTVSSDVATAVDDFIGSVEILKSRLGVKTIKRDFGGPMYAMRTDLAKVNVSLKDAVAEIKRGSRIAVIMRYVETFKEDVDEVVESAMRAKGVPLDELDQERLQKFVVAVEDLQQIITDRVEAGYKLSDDAIDVGNEMEARIADLIERLSTISSDAYDRVGNLNEYMEAVSNRRDELLLERFGENEDAITAYSEAYVNTSPIKDDKTIEYMTEAVDGTKTIVDIAQDDADLGAVVVAKYAKAADSIVEKRPEEMTLDEVEGVYDLVNNLINQYMSVNHWLSTTHDVLYEKYMAFNVNSISDEHIIPAIERLEKTAGELGDLIDVADDHLGTSNAMFAIRHDQDAGRSMRRDLDSLGYYSGALEAAKGLKQAKGAPEQMLAQLKAGGARQAELDTAKLAAFLDGKKSVTRDEIVSHLEKNRVLVREAEYSRTAGSESWRVNKRLAEWREEQLDTARFEQLSGNGEDAFYESNARKQAVEWLEKNGVSFDNSLLNGDPIAAFAAAGVKVTPGRIGIWSESNGNFYIVEHPDGRSLSLSDFDSFPHEGPSKVDAIKVLESQAEIDVRDNIMAYVPEYERELRETLDDPDPTRWSAYSLDPSNPTYRETVLHLPENGDDFQSGHFYEPNIIGHMMTSMTKHDGRPVYTINQIQSDWGQKLRDGGVRDEKKIAELKAKIDEINAAAASVDAGSWRFKVENFGRNRGLNVGMRDDHVGMRRQIERLADRRDDIGAQASKLLEDEPMKVSTDDFGRLRSELATAESATPGHPLVNTTDQWVNTTLRRSLRQAAEADADYIAIPSGDTVLSYNPGDKDGMRGFYDGIVPKNLRNILRKIDKSSPDMIRVDKLETPTQGMKGKGFSVFPLTDTVKRSVLDDGQPLFAINAYHGSSSKFDEVDLDFVNAGAKSQKYGWGFYASSRQQVGTNWAHTVARNTGGRPYLYTVTLDAEPYQLMRWESKMSAQPEQVRRAVEAVSAEHKLTIDADSTGEAIYRALSKKLGERGASSALYDAGIRGNVQSNTTARNGTFDNYVMFDEADVRVETREPAPKPQLQSIADDVRDTFSEVAEQMQRSAADTAGDPHLVAAITDRVSGLIGRHGLSMPDAESVAAIVNRVTEDVANGNNVVDAVTREIQAVLPSGAGPLFAMRDANGRMKAGAQARAKSLADDLAQIEYDMKTGSIDDRAALQQKRASLLNAKAEDAGLDDMNGHLNARGEKDAAMGYLRMVETYGRGGFKGDDVWTLKNTIANEAMRRMGEFVWTARKGAILGDLRRTVNKSVSARIENVIREAAGEQTSDAMAKRMAKAWLDTAEWLRQQFNAYGGDIGKLTGWFAPQYHDAQALLSAGRSAWVKYLMADGVLDRDRMLDRAGNRLSDSALAELLTDIWRTITTGGASDREVTGRSGGGALYKRHSEHRVLHFKGADAYLKYARDFGGGDVYAMMIGHVQTMARDIAALRRFGANPETVRGRLAEHLRQEALMQRSGRSVYDDLADAVADLKIQADVIKGPVDDAMRKIADIHTELDGIANKKRHAARRDALHKSLGDAHAQMRDAIGKGPMTAEKMEIVQRIISLTDEMSEIAEQYPVMSRDPVTRVERVITRADEMWKTYTGHTNTPVDGVIAGYMTAARNIVSSSTLAFAPISAITDQATGLAARAFVGMPVTQQLQSFLKSFSPANRREALELGFGLDQAAAAFAVQSRFAGWVDTRSISGYIADRGHAFSGLSPMTQASKIGFSSDFVRWMARLAKDHSFESLEPWTRDMLLRHGFTADDWSRLRTVSPEISRGVEVMSYQAIARQAGEELAEKYQRVHLRERAMAVLEPTLQGRTAFISETRPGTVIGEIMRSGAMLKSFPTSYMMLILGRFYDELQAGNMGRHNTIVAAASIFVVGTLLGALVRQAKSITQGRDAEDMTNPDFWAKSFMQSGGAGIFGDFMASAVSRTGGGFERTLAGPMPDRVANLFNLTVGNAVQYARDEKTNAGREAVKFAKQNTPLIPWYLRSAYEHMILDQIQSKVDPDVYRARQSRMQLFKKLNGTDFYWPPGAVVPTRSPNISRAFGAGK